MPSLAISISVLASAAQATLLPSFQVDRTGLQNASLLEIGKLERDGKWWVRLGDAVFYQPGSAQKLSDHVGHYYHAVGYQSALTQDLRKHWVGGTGVHNLFYLPQGPSMLQTDIHVGDRRSTFSALTQLKSGLVIPETFPVYNLAVTYANPLSLRAQEVESAAISHITEGLCTSLLQNLTSLPHGAQQPTRSFDDDAASLAATSFLEEQFKAMNLATCTHSFAAMGRQRQNVIGFVPGRSADSIIVGAHYDSRPYSGAAPGAEDNGSGVAAMLAMASALAKANVVPSKSIYFVGFAGEEKGMLGSDRFAQDLTSSADSIPSNCRPSKASSSFLQAKKAAPDYSAIILDEVGWISPASTQRPIVNLESYDWSKDVLEHLAQSSKTHNGEGLKVVHSNNPFGSDHMSFLQRQQQAVLTINGFDGDYPCYHQSCDKIENVSPWLMAAVAKMNLGALLRMAGVHA